MWWNNILYQKYIFIKNRYDYNLTIMKWSLPNQIMCFLLPVDSKPTADKMSVNKSKATFEIEQCWIFAVLWRPFWKWRPVEIFRYRESIRDIIIYLHMKFRWNRTMLNLCGIVAAILKMATSRNFRCQESIRDIIIYPHIKFCSCAKERKVNENKNKNNKIWL